ncbi:phosphoribosylaminoimidazolesuccinocarboxamide synthase [Candidatus Saccharibacteria bacterium]|nr:phosphoribosylaminoimidazolesuccinocarboxamide synthase [Candidatus Saccharibacteria bacterium]
MAVTIQETNFDFPGQVGNAYHGKVADTYAIDHPDAGPLLAVVRTDRISAFDVVLPQSIPYKGQVLNQMSAAILSEMQDVAPNWFVGTPDANVTVGRRAEPFKIEMIMRGALLGTAWRNYQEGMREICGNRLPDGMSEFQFFPEPLVTPTTKADQGHDQDITPAEIVEQGLATQAQYDTMAGYATDMFLAGQVWAREKGLYFADTKYEFGRLVTGEIVLIDEVNTPDSSRYFHGAQFRNYVERETSNRPEQLSKEFVREWLREQGFSGQEGQEPPVMPPEMVEAVTSRYLGLYERMLGEPFYEVVSIDETHRLDMMRSAVTNFLDQLTD